LRGHNGADLIGGKTPSTFEYLAEIPSDYCCGCLIPRKRVLSRAEAR